MFRDEKLERRVIALEAEIENIRQLLKYHGLRRGNNYSICPEIGIGEQLDNTRKMVDRIYSYFRFEEVHEPEKIYLKKKNQERR